MELDEMIRSLDRVEADLRRLEHRVFAVREALRKRVDPYKRRTDLGYWPADEDAERKG